MEAIGATLCLGMSLHYPHLKCSVNGKVHEFDIQTCAMDTTFMESKFNSKIEFIGRGHLVLDNRETFSEWNFWRIR
jgi:hypothetical protein